MKQPFVRRILLGVVAFLGIGISTGIPLLWAQFKNGDSYPTVYQELFSACVKAGGQLQLDPDSCATWVQFCLNQNLDCLKKAGCTLSDEAIPKLVCQQDISQCGSPDQSALALQFKQSQKCSSLPGDLSQPGCANHIIEIGESCDDGNKFDNDGCPANCGIIPPGPQCGNGKVEPGEECDAGPNNGKNSAVCDIECKKMAVCADNGVNKGVGVAEPEPNKEPATTSCGLKKAAKQ